MALANVTGCFGGPDIICGPFSFEIPIPPERASDVASVTATGKPCEGRAFECLEDASAQCTDYRLVPSGELGTCTVRVEFESGADPFVATVSYTRAPEVCGGARASDGVIEVPQLPNR